MQTVAQYPHKAPRDTWTHGLGGSLGHNLHGEYEGTPNQAQGQAQEPPVAPVEVET